MLLPHPYHGIMNLEQRSAELFAESTRDHQARLAEKAASTPSARRWLDLLATLVVLVALALLVAAGAATPAESPLTDLPAAIMLP